MFTVLTHIIFRDVDTGIIISEDDVLRIAKTMSPYIRSVPKDATMRAWTAPRVCKERLQARMCAENMCVYGETQFIYVCREHVCIWSDSIHVRVEETCMRIERLR